MQEATKEGGKRKVNWDLAVPGLEKQQRLQRQICRSWNKFVLMSSEPPIPALWTPTQQLKGVDS